MYCPSRKAFETGLGLHPADLVFKYLLADCLPKIDSLCSNAYVVRSGRSFTEATSDFAVSNRWKIILDFE